MCVNHYSAEIDSSHVDLFQLEVLACESVHQLIAAAG